MPAEPVSPELVLVDPELAERERARLREEARLQEILDVAVLRRAVEHHTTLDEAPESEVAVHRGWHEVVEFARRRLVLATVLCSLLANGVLVARLVAEPDDTATVGAPVAERPATLLPTSTVALLPTSTVTLLPTSTVPATTAAPTRVRRRSNATKVTAAAVERRLVASILAEPKRKLLRAFVDPRTGLVKNNVQVVCRRATKRSFRCAVRLPSSGANELVLRYRLDRDGRGVFSWPS